MHTRSPSLILLFLVSVPLLVHTLSLSSIIEPMEKQHCFYAVVKDTRNTLHFYYSESVTKLTKGSGQSSPVKLQVFGPSGELIQDHPPKAVMEATVQPPVPGEYAFCLQHTGNPTRKVIDIDLSEQKAENVTKEGILINDDPKSGLGLKLEKTNQKLRNDLEDMLHTLKYIKNREKRNMETVEESNSRIVWFSFLECVLVIGMAVLQVTVLKQLFGSNSRPRV